MVGEDGGSDNCSFRGVVHHGDGDYDVPDQPGCKPPLRPAWRLVPESEFTGRKRLTSSDQEGERLLIYGMQDEAAGFGR